MSSKQYDIAIIGGSLTARIASTLLAKQGNKVLFIRNKEAKAPAWFHSSVFLENLLGVLGGRSCFAAQQPIQVLSECARVTISNDISLEDELAREFGHKSESVLKWLIELQNIGIKLEQLFWENGGLPWASFKTSASFKILCMRRKVNLPQLEQPVSARLKHFSAPVRTFLSDLLQGLSLTDTTDLSFARAALLWAQALRPENLIEPDFSILLKKRFDQFHGAKASLEDLSSLDYDGSRWTGGQFKSGGRFTARHFLLGDKRWVNLFKAGDAQLPLPAKAPKAFSTTDLCGQLSPLLEKRVICGGPLPLRIAIEEKDQELQGIVLSNECAAEESIRQQLEQALPFAKYQMQEQTSGNTQKERLQNLQSLANLPIRIGANLYCADRTVLLPEMGAAGAAMLAWTLTKNLGISKVEGKG